MSTIANYPTAEEKKVLEFAEEVMERSMAAYDPSHDAYHVYRVRNTALALARANATQNPDLLVVELAALFHDMVDKKYASWPVDTVEQIGEHFKPIFRDAASKSRIDLVADGRADLIAKIVFNISWSTETKLRKAGEITKWHEDCIELHCVQDADRLDAIGAFGIMRCAAYSAVKNTVLHVPPTDPRASGAAIQHFHDKLLNIKERLKTDTGKRMGEERHQFMIQFLAAVDKEYSVALP